MWSLWRSAGSSPSPGACATAPRASAFRCSETQATFLLPAMSCCLHPFMWPVPCWSFSPGVLHSCHLLSFTSCQALPWFLLLIPPPAEQGRVGGKVFPFTFSALQTQLRSLHCCPTLAAFNFSSTFPSLPHNPVPDGCSFPPTPVPGVSACHRSLLSPTFWLRFPQVTLLGALLKKLDLWVFSLGEGDLKLIPVP